MKGVCASCKGTGTRRPLRSSLTLAILSRGMKALNQKPHLPEPLLADTCQCLQPELIYNHLKLMYHQWRWVWSIPECFLVLAYFGLFLSIKKATSGKPRGPDWVCCALAEIPPDSSAHGCWMQRRCWRCWCHCPQKSWCFLQGQSTLSQIWVLEWSYVIGVQVCDCPSSLFLIALVA